MFIRNIKCEGCLGALRTGNPKAKYHKNYDCIRLGLIRNNPEWTDSTHPRYIPSLKALATQRGLTIERQDGKYKITDDSLTEDDYNAPWRIEQQRLMDEAHGFGFFMPPRKAWDIMAIRHARRTAAKYPHPNLPPRGRHDEHIDNLWNGEIYA